MRFARLVPAVLTAAVLAACTPGVDAPTSASADGQARTLTVFAAASLTETFAALAPLFEAAHPGVDVALSHAGSQTLVDQIDNGAPADLLATADETSMSRALEAGLVSTPRVFATNSLTLITPAGNPAHVTGLDASIDEARLVICAPEVPCGRATLALTGALGVTLHPVSEENKVTDVRARVASGEADAGIVYRTDALAAGDAVEEIPLPEVAEAVNTYPVAVVDGAREADLAGEFVELLLSEEGRDVLVAHGFTVPEGER